MKTLKFLALGLAFAAGQSLFSAEPDTVALTPVTQHETATVKKKHTLEFTVNVQLPADEDSRLYAPVRSWAMGLLFGQTGLTPDDTTGSAGEVAERMAKAYVKRGKAEIADLAKMARRDGTDSRFNYAFDLSVQRVYETRRFITFVAETYNYAGGAHGVQTRVYATFVKASGHRLTWDDIILPKRKAKFCGLVTDGLQDFFGVKGFAALKERLLVEGKVSRTSFPLPKNGPGLLEDGLRVQYEAYEIAPYAAGQPLSVVPYSAMRGVWSKMGVSIWR